MSAKIIISYDGTPNDDDALALGKMLARGGGQAGARHTCATPGNSTRAEKELAQHDAEQRLERGAALVGGRGRVMRHVVVGRIHRRGPSSSWLIPKGASLIVFGSDYRTSPGHAEARPNTAQHLLDGGSVAIAGRHRRACGRTSTARSAQSPYPVAGAAQRRRAGRRPRAPRREARRDGLSIPAPSKST